MIPVGLWVWNLLTDQEEGRGTLMDNLSFLHDHGVTRLYVKAGDGPTLWQQFAKSADRLRAAGFEVWSWQYVYGAEQAKEVAPALSAYLIGSEGHILDAETEFAGKDPTELISRIREVDPSWPLWYSSFAFPEYHSGFPWDQFHEQCDGAMPQVFPAYGSLWRPDAGTQTAESYARRLGDGKLVPTWEMFDRQGAPLPSVWWEPALADAEQFGRLDVFRWGKVGPGGWAVLSEEPSHSELQTRLDYLQGDVAAAIEGPIRSALTYKSLPKRARAGLGAALDAVDTLKREGR